MSEVQINVYFKPFFSEQTTQVRIIHGGIYPLYSLRMVSARL